MAAVDDVISAIEQVQGELGGGDGAYNKAIEEADDAIGKANDVGDPKTVEAFTAIKDELEQLRQQLGALIEATDGVLDQAKAIQGGS